MSNSMVELMMDGVLDYLIDAGTFKAPAGRVLSSHNPVTGGHIRGSTVQHKGPKGFDVG